MSIRAINSGSIEGRPVLMQYGARWPRGVQRIGLNRPACVGGTASQTFERGAQRREVRVVRDCGFGQRESNPRETRIHRATGYAQKERKRGGVSGFLELPL
jgi:hypothetical protein